MSAHCPTHDHRVGTLEFVGPNEEHGWPLAGTIVPIAYIAWSAWLIALGVGFIL